MASWVLPEYGSLSPLPRNYPTQRTGLASTNTRIGASSATCASRERNWALKVNAPRSFQYFDEENRVGERIGVANVVEDEFDPSPQQLADVRPAIRKHCGQSGESGTNSSLHTDNLIHENGAHNFLVTNK
ncbi:hypothetical protein LguiA_023794 [Lonicera macranthoides]